MANDNQVRQIPLAIVGMACRLPGADNLDQFWTMLIEGRSAVVDLPPDRFDRNLYYDAKRGVRNKSYSCRGAVLEQRPDDPVRSPIPPQLDRRADITHRVMCQVAVEALQHAQLDPFNLPQRNVGVYVGHTLGSDPARLARHIPAAEDAAQCLDSLAELSPPKRKELCQQLVAQIRGEQPTASADDSSQSAHMAAGIIAKALGLNGPFMAVNAACASSLEALVLAGRALQLGQIDMALVGGSSVCSRDWQVLFSQAQSLSDADSRPFDHRADGLVVAEASVALVVKTLDQAIAHGDPIQAVIRGLGISSDGRGRSLWAPRSEGQVAAMRRAYHPGVDLADTQYIEAHATATQLGDATEIASLRQVFEGTLPPGKTIPIASVKANLGHTLEAAGLVGVIKTVLCMQKGAIPRAIHIETLNPKVDWSSSPFFVPLETIAWPQPNDGKPRRAGVNAFGIGGLNVHVVLEAHAGVTQPSSAPIVHLSHADDQAVAVIGLGCVFPGVQDVAAFAKLLRSASETNAHGLAGSRHVVDFHYDWRPHRIAPKEIELADPLQFMVLEAADQALRGAGYGEKAFDRQQTGVVVGTEFAGDFGHRLQLTLNLPHTQKQLRELLVAQGLSVPRAAEIVAAFAEAWHARWPVLLDNSGSYSASSLAVRIAKTWDLMGGAVALDSGPTSAMSALQAAIDLLHAGDCSMVVCAAGQRNLRAMLQAGTANQSAKQGLPFDRNGSGLVPAEGAGVLLLKRLSDARRDGDPIHAILRGVGVAHDDPAHALSQAIEHSVEASQVSPRDLSLVVCDACGDAPTDELLLRAVLNSQTPVGRDEPLPVRSVVGQFGHLGGASGMASLLASVIALEEGLAPSAQGIETPLTLALRNKKLVQCQGPTTPLASHGLEHAITSAVISQGDDLAYCALIERAPIAEKRQATVPPPVVEMLPKPVPHHVGQNGSAKRAAPVDFARVLVGQLVELTGYPPEVLDFDADLQADLSIRPDETLQLVSQVQRSLALNGQAPPEPQTLRTLRQVLDFLQGSTSKVSSNGHSHASGNGHAAPAAKKTIARRSRLEIVEAPWPAGPAPRFTAHGAVLILGDNPVADALRQQLEADGAAVHILRPADGIEAVLANTQSLLAEAPVRHLCILTALDPATEPLRDAALWQTRRSLGLELPVLVVQKWRQRLAQDRIAAPITISAATMLGGDFGIAEPVVAPEGGWVAGFLKSVNVELNRHQQPTIVKVCDFAPTDHPQAMASDMLRELAAGQPEVEVALSAGRRRVLRTVAQGTGQLARVPLARGTTWVVTGGARGITAEVAIKLGLEYGLKLHLIGRSAAPSPDAPWRNCTPDELKSIKRSIVRQAIAEGKSPEKQWDRVKNDIEIDKNLSRMQKLGLDVTYHSCDVSDWAALDGVLHEVRRQSGPIVGIVHGAGYARTSRLEILKRETLANTMDAKVSGALALMQLTRHDPLRYFVGFGSISGRFGGNGLSDYAAANGMLATLCAWYRVERPDCATTCIDWQSWDEVGMAMLPDSSVGTRGVLKMKFIPPAEGVEHLQNELCAGLPEREILIDDGEFERLLWTAAD